MGAVPAPGYCCCGTRLASDNVGALCAACQRQRRDRLIAPPLVPAIFWQTDQLRDAFAARHIGKVCRAYRLHPYHAATYGAGGISQALMGQWVGLTQAQVSRIESGPALKYLDTLTHWARVLRIPPERLWFDMPGSQRHAAASCGALGVEGAQENRREEDAAKRREAITLVGKALPAATAPGIFGTVEWVVSSHRRERVDRRLVSAHEEVAEALAGLYRSTDPRSALPTAMAYADELLNVLDAPMGDNERGALNAIVVGVHAQVGLWACHMHRSSLAYRYLATGCEVAAAAHDRPLRARALGALSYLFSSAPRGGQGGNPRRCLELLDEALDLAVHADPFTRGWLATWRADQHATLGDLSAARADVEAADLGLGSADGGQLAGFFARPNYGYGMDGHLNSVRAVVLSLAGDAQQSQRTFDHVQVSAANMRRRIATYGHDALVQVHRRDPESACDALSRSVQFAVQENYAMGLERAIGVRSGFDGSWADLPAVRDIDDQLRQLTIL